MNRYYIVFMIVLASIVGCGEDKETQIKLDQIKEIQQLIQAENFEAARVAAIDTLEPEVKTLYYQADDNLGHASHLDVRCNERIAEVLYDIVKRIPAKDIKINKYIYSKLLSMYPENQLYKRKFIYYDRKVRTSKK